jgi:hypothetical protein
MGDKDFVDLQLETFKQMLRDGKANRKLPAYEDCLKWLEKFPRKLTPEEQADVKELLNATYQIGEQDVNKPSSAFDHLVPRTGWFRKYYEYTLGSEAPAPFHFAAALTTLGAALGRGVYFDKGFYRVYGNTAAVLIAPTGKCRKTSATNVALGLARDVGVRVLSDRITPEALVTGLGGQEDAVGLLYAPELAVFLGRQKYLEGMVPLLTSLFDAPEYWESRTIVRGELKLHRVALSMLGASTIEWFVEALPREAFSGGFMSRILFIVQTETDREFALPIRPEGHLLEALKEDLKVMQNVKGEVFLTPETTRWYQDWYSGHHKAGFSDEKFAGYHERKPDHLLRIAMILKVASAQSLTLSVADMEQALHILNWLEVGLPSIFKSVAETSQGVMHQRFLKQLEQAGGTIAHSVLLRRNQHIVNARQFREIIDTLKESECIKETHTALEHFYELRGKK